MSVTYAKYLIYDSYIAFYPSMEEEEVPTCKVAEEL